ncbi:MULTISPECIES: DsbA family protein [unclassified Paracoccus (in: a-proteobacteria)]|uniref:DsbA family protein n=1 Tax=unclassified Paracoccus (in: a-proteobacteria) TaxID=2688777 RepID=UPI0012B2C117|nr:MULTISPECIES: DsbA family protein [unclassified Paracoccus (in: a-proteobacteria)]UXU75091.1 DsbA family protein [Paracoccus sp. SMMA_5]UXU80994.1 DsbA family protein [Paracoccus sp. SMMA_5_TC]
MMLLRRSLIAAAAAALTAAALPALAQEAKPADTSQSSEQMPEGKVLADIVLGQESAPVTIVEYASFTCPHCANFHNDNMSRLKSEYIDTGKVRFIQRDVYFDAPGLWAGILARCGGDDKYYAMTDIIFSEQKTWMSAKSGDELAANLRKLGAKAGMTPEQMDACWNDRQKVADLLATFQANATKDKIEGTPTFIIDGETVQNQPWDDMKKIIDAKLAAKG